MLLFCVLVSIWLMFSLNFLFWEPMFALDVTSPFIRLNEVGKEDNYIINITCKEIHCIILSLCLCLSSFPPFPFLPPISSSNFPLLPPSLSLFPSLCLSSHLLFLPLLFSLLFNLHLSWNIIILLMIIIILPGLLPECVCGLGTARKGDRAGKASRTYHRCRSSGPTTC